VGGQLARAAMASHLYATACMETENLHQETDWHASLVESHCAAIAKAAAQNRALPTEEVAKEIGWQTLRLEVRLPDLVDPDMWKITNSHYERGHDILANKKQPGPMHNGSQVRLELGSLVWAPVSGFTGGNAPQLDSLDGAPVSGFTGGSAPLAKSVKWYRALASNDRNSTSTWFPCLHHAVAVGIYMGRLNGIGLPISTGWDLNGGVPRDFGSEIGPSIMVHQLEMAETKVVDLMQHKYVLRRHSMVETWEVRFPLTKVVEAIAAEEAETETKPEMRATLMAVGMKLSSCTIEAPTFSIPDSWQTLACVYKGAKRRRLVKSVALAKSDLACLEQDLGLAKKALACLEQDLGELEDSAPSIHSSGSSNN
jgi:hypothetical protein